MSVYAITGSASGMGRETAQRLRGAGHTVIGVDLRDADVIADLSTAEGRGRAAAGVLEASGGTLDGAVLAAGLGPTPGRDRPRMIAQVNYFGVRRGRRWPRPGAPESPPKSSSSPVTPRRRCPQCPAGPSRRCSSTMLRRRCVRFGYSVRAPRP